MNFKELELKLHVDRTALAFGAAGLCLGSLLTYSWLYSTAPQQKPRQRRRTHSSTGAESEPGTPRSGAESVSAFDSPQLLLVVNKELKLSPGKLGEHCAHAAVGQVKKLTGKGNPCVFAWDKAGGAKVCAGVESETDLIDLREKARQAGLSTFAVQDRSGSNGKTHVSVLAVGPGSEHIMAEVLGQLCILS